MWQNTVDTPSTKDRICDEGRTSIVDNNPKNTFERAIALLKNGAQDDAEELCRAWLEQNSRDVNFLSLLGTILLLLLM